MRRRIAIPLIAAAALAPWLWFFPDSPENVHAGHLMTVLDIPRDDARIGGLSGIDVSADGKSFYLVTDRGHIAKGVFTRSDDILTGVTITDVQPLFDRFGKTREFPHTDAEGIAVDAEDRVYVSFEHAHRVLVYDAWGLPARWPSYTKSWRALSRNKGMEALAVSPDGTLFTVPEQINNGAWAALVYRRKANGAWEQPFTLPVDDEFAPVGADFGPDGSLYVLERGLYPFGFYSRVRAMTVTPEGLVDIRTVLQTSLGEHGNLEGLAIWADSNGTLRLTMVSDDNFHFFMRNQVVEYALYDGVAILSD